MLAGIYIPQQSDRVGGGETVHDALEIAYFRRALRVLRNVNKDTRFIWFSEQQTEALCDHVPTEVIQKRAGLLRSASGDAPSLEQALEMHKADVLLTTVDAPPVRTSLPKVVFTLDMMLQSGAVSAKKKLHPALPRAVKRNCADARLFLCPSAYVQKLCATQVEVGLEKTVLARAGVDEVFSQPRPSIIDGPYVLFPMNRYTWQNIKTVTEALRRNPALFPPTLVVVGPIHPNEPKSWGLPVIRIEQCPDALAAALLQHAEAVLYPAQGDGSGMLALQALRAGAQLITSKSGANFEMAGTTPFYCEADNPVSLLQVMRRMMDETADERKKRQKMGRTLVMDCTWEQCAGKIVSAVKRSLLPKNT